MPKSTGHNCFQCSKFSTEQARAKDCWSEKCYNRRHYHQNKGRTNSIKRQRRTSAREDSPKVIAVPHPQQGHAANIIFYRERQNAPVHAITTEVWKGSQKVLAVQPIHCLGLSPAQVVATMSEILKACSGELGIELSKFASKIELNPSLCPIRPCPLCSPNN